MTHTKISRLISSRKKVLPRETETVNFFQLGHSVLPPDQEDDQHQIKYPAAVKNPAKFYAPPARTPVAVFEPEESESGKSPLMYLNV